MSAAEHQIHTEDELADLWHKLANRLHDEMWRAETTIETLKARVLAARKERDCAVQHEVMAIDGWAKRGRKAEKERDEALSKEDADLQRLSDAVRERNEAVACMNSYALELAGLRRILDVPDDHPLNLAIESLKRERDKAIARAEKAEAQLEMSHAQIVNRAELDLADAREVLRAHDGIAGDPGASAPVAQRISAILDALREARETARTLTDGIQVDVHRPATQRIVNAWTRARLW